MGLKALVLAGATLATITVGFTAPAFASTQVTASAQLTGQGDGTDEVSGLGGRDSEVCSALDAETIPTGDDVARCLSGTKLV